ncbi:MAG: hypothetical protein RL215_1490 [Planctomycetota bacterium]
MVPRSQVMPAVCVAMAAVCEASSLAVAGSLVMSRKAGLGDFCSLMQAASTSR